MNKDKVINDLLSRIAKLEYEVEELNNIIEEQDKELEIERLNQYIDFYKYLTEKQNKEIERLNNIINEIEAIIYNNQITGIEARLEIQELKGESNEED